MTTQNVTKKSLQKKLFFELIRNQFAISKIELKNEAEVTSKKRKKTAFTITTSVGNIIE